MTAPTVLLVPSPLVGAVSWRPVAACLTERGRHAVVVDTGRPRLPHDVVERVLAAADGCGPVLLVPHSNAGYYVPTLADRLDVSTTVFVDAALAEDGPDTGLAPPAMLEWLRTMADPDGILPPWTRWWDDLAGVFPDEATRTAVERALPRLPLSYFNARLPVPPGWAARPAAYLAFGDTYAAETARARAHGWPVAVVEGGHLQPLHDPDGVAAAVLRLEAALVRPPVSGED